MKSIFTAAAAAITVTALTMGTASATIFAKDYHDAGVWNAYDDQSQTYSMKFTDDGSKDGFWLVVSPGGNPKTNADEYAILYGDRAANKITAYTYDGANNANSFKTGDYLGTFDNAFSDGGTIDGYGDTTMFSLDVSGINSALNTADWSGVSFGAEQGIWFHQSSGSEFAYNTDGTLADYVFTNQMWLDTAHETTGRRTCNAQNTGKYFCQPGTGIGNTGAGGAGGAAGAVPAPGGLALILMGLAGFGMRRKK